MRFLYNTVLAILFLGYLPTFLARWWESRKDAPGFSARLGFYPQALRERWNGKRPVWIQAVSVGEVLCLKKLIRRFREECEGQPLTISTTTVTGQRMAKKLAGEGGATFYYPLDLAPITRRVVQVVRPKLYVMVETEIWPGLVRELKLHSIPVLLVNGRISDRSYTRYRALSRLMKPVLGGIDRFLMQTDRDADRVVSLGAPRDRVRVAGNLKFDNILSTSEIEAPDGTSEKVSRLWPGARIWVAGSTHAGEYEALLEAYEGAVAEVPVLRVVFAPRHMKDVPRLEALFRRRGIPAERWSRVRNGLPSNARAIIVDGFGELASFYRVADVVFIGGTLIPKGGQNPIEAAQFARPVLFGPHVSNFQEVFDRLTQARAAFPTDRYTLRDTLVRLLKDPESLVEAGRRARAVVEEATGASEQTLAELKRWL